MSWPKILGTGLAVLLALGGVLFLVAAGQGNALARIVIGVVLLLAAGTLVALGRLRPVHETRVVKQDLHLSGDVSLEDMKCRECGGTLGRESVEVRAGAVFVSCPFCDASYQLEEAPKW